MKDLTLTEMAKLILSTTEAVDKVKLSEKYATAWQEDRKSRKVIKIGQVDCQETTTRPSNPKIIPPRLMHKR